MLLARLIERITRNYGEKRLTCDGLLYKLTILNFASYLVQTISSYLRGRTFESSFQTPKSSRRTIRAGVAQGGLISPVLFSLYVNDMPTPPHHVPQADAARQLPGIVTQQPSAVVEGMENRHKCLKDRLDNLPEGRTAPHPALTSNTFRGANPMGRHNTLSGSDPR